MALRVGTLLPSLEGATQWFNGEISAEELRGHSVLLHFWSVSCPVECCYGFCDAGYDGTKKCKY